MKKKKVKVRVPSTFLKDSKKGSVKKKYKVRVPSKFLEKSGITAKKKLKVRVPSKFLKPITKSTNADKPTMTKKKLKVRVPSKFLKRVVKKQVVKSKKKIKLVKRRKVGGATTATSPSRNSSALNKLKRFVRSKRGVKVHPIIRSSDD